MIRPLMYVPTTCMWGGLIARVYSDTILVEKLAQCKSHSYPLLPSPSPPLPSPPSPPLPLPTSPSPPPPLPLSPSPPSPPSPSPLQRYIQSDIRGYSPAPGDLAYPDKLIVAAQATTVEPETDSDSVFENSGTEVNPLPPIVAFGYNHE